MKEALKNAIERNLEKLSSLDSAGRHPIGAEIEEFFTDLLSCLVPDEGVAEERKDAIDFIDDKEDLLIKKPSLKSDIVQMFLHLFDENSALKKGEKMFPEDMPHDFLLRFSERISSEDFARGCANFIFDKSHSENNIQQLDFHDAIDMACDIAKEKCYEIDDFRNDNNPSTSVETKGSTRLVESKYLQQQ